MTATPFELIEGVADAVMFEGYVLYPYRASAIKNRFRWQFGIVAPRATADRLGDEPSHAQTECLVDCGAGSAVTVKVRCLHLQRRTIEEWIDDTREWRPCDHVAVDGHEWQTWDEAQLQTLESPLLPLERLTSGAYTMPFNFASANESEIARRADGTPAARVTRQTCPVSGLVCISSQRVGDFMKVRVRIENTTARSADDSRDSALRQSLLGCHTMLHVQDGQFVSLIDPPRDAVAAAKFCENQHTWPVLAGPPTTRELMLSAPIILYDYPVIAPESHDRFFDATEIDEMLALRVLTMTDDEKREAVATDPHASAIVQRVSGPDDAALHGAIRSFEEWLNPSVSSGHADVVEIESVSVMPGSRVRLDPQRRADSMDMFLAGRVATVAAVQRDLENRVYLAVTIDGDPGADLHEAYGRFFYFFPHEVHPADVADASG
jgi:hypothetical protein